MKGYIFEYYKYLQYMKNSLDDIKDILPLSDAEESMLTFGDYDRLRINVVTEFSRYRDLSSQASKWVGNRQSIFLYELDDISNLEFVTDKDGSNFLNPKTREFCNSLFFALTEFRFKDKPNENGADGKNIYTVRMNEAKEELRKEIGNADEIEAFSVLGTLGSFSIVVIWFSDQYTEILKLVSQIRKECQELFWDAHTIISKNPNAKKSRADYREVIEKIEGSALLQLALKKNMTEMDKKLLEKKGIRKFVHTVGEYDIIGKLEAKTAFSLFEDENMSILKHDSNEFQSRFLKTKITLGETDSFSSLSDIISDNADKKSEETVCVSSKLKGNLEKVDKLYTDIRKWIYKNVEKTAGLIDTFDTLMCDYRSNVASADNENWQEDFCYIFYQNLCCIKEMYNMNGAQDSELRQNFLDNTRFILNNLKQQIFHVAEANVLNYEIPKCHLRYTGQEDSIMRCYLGIIKMILKQAYALESYNKQSEIVPMLTLDAVPIIESDLYFDKVSFVDKDQFDQNFKILSLNLPHVSFYDIPNYMQYMYHEIFHYIVPRNREQRDYNMGIIFTVLHMTYMYKEYISRLIKNTGIGKNIEQKTIEILGELVAPLIYQYVGKNYLKKIHEIIIQDKNQIKLDRNKVAFVAEKYKESLVEYLSNVSGKVIFEECKNQVCQDLLADNYVTIYQEMMNELSCKDAKLKQLIGNEMNSEKAKDELTDIWKDEDIKENVKSLVEKILEGMREFSADLPMVQFSEMPLDEYMLFYSNILKNNLITPYDIDLTIDLKEAIRVGVILDWYEKNGQKVENSEQDFQAKFLAKYCTSGNRHLEDLDFQSKLQKWLDEAKEWIAFFKKCYKIYQQQFKLFSQQFSLVREETDICKRKSVSEPMNTVVGMLKEYREYFKEFAEALKEIASESDENEARKKFEGIKKKFDEECFKSNIQFLQYFQKQESLTVLSQYNERRNTKKEEQGEKNISSFVSANLPISVNSRIILHPTYIAHSMDDFWKKYNWIMEECVTNAKIKQKKDISFWYRGQRNAAYSLLPGNMRTTNKKHWETFNYLSQYQRSLYEKFKHHADGSLEMGYASFYNETDYISLMQHYSVLTNWIDWSDDIITGLYFAMEKVLNGEENEAEHNAAIYIFNPYWYNQVRKELMPERKRKKHPSKHFDAANRTKDDYDGEIPNLSADYKKELYDTFILGHAKYEYNKKYGCTRKKQLSGGDEMAYLPVAIHTSKLSRRIRAQSGNFVAFNLYAEPSNDINEPFEYISLESIQDYYLNQGACADRVPFLYKIEIDKSAVKEVAESLKRMGVSKAHIYPELENIGKGIS